MSEAENNIRKTMPSEAMQAVDMLLGLALLLIIFDYARDFLSGAEYLPTDLNKTTLSIFMSRWLTYFGAPILMFVAGLQVGFRKILGWQSKNLAIFLIKRGVVLLLIDLLIVSFGFNFSFAYPSYFMMLSALGFSFIGLAALVYLPFWASLIIGLSIIFGHDLLPAIQGKETVGVQAIGMILHGQGTVKIFGHYLFVVYSVIPWLGVVALGYGMAALYHLETVTRKLLLMRAGLVLTIGFVVLRIVNSYGDPEHWWVHSQPIFTILSFINVSKFPASVQYLLLTLGPSFMLLSWFEGRGRGLPRRLAVFGRVPLFFYISSLYIIHVLSILAGGFQGFQPALFISPVWLFPDEFGFGTIAILMFSLIVFAALYPLCRLVDSALGEQFANENMGGPLSWGQRIKTGLRNF